MTAEIVTVDRTIPVPRSRMRTIAWEVCRRYKTSLDKVVAKGKRRNAFLSVRVEIARALTAAGYSTTQIGRLLDRDHTTVLWYLGRLNNPRRRPLP